MGSNNSSELNDYVGNTVFTITQNQLSRKQLCSSVVACELLIRHLTWVLTYLLMIFTGTRSCFYFY